MKNDALYEFNTLLIHLICKG